MKKRPVKVRLIGKKGNFYQIQFPNLKIPVTVDENLYNKMIQSTAYEFDNLNQRFKQRSYSA